MIELKQDNFLLTKYNLDLKRRLEKIPAESQDDDENDEESITGFVELQAAEASIENEGVLK